MQQKIVGYVYYHLYELIRNVKGKHPIESAQLYILWIIIGITFPFSGWLVFNVFGKGYMLIYFIAALLYAFLVYIWNKKVLMSKVIFEDVVRFYENQGREKKIIGYVTVVLLVILSPIIGFFILTLL